MNLFAASLPRYSRQLVRFCLLLWIPLVLVPDLLRSQEIQVHATGTVVGSVSSAKTRNMLEGVVVEVQGGKFGAVTDHDGNFTITGIPVGNVELVFTASDFDEKRKVVEVTSQGRTQAAVELEPTSVLLLPKYTVAAEAEGNARAVTRQRVATNNISVNAIDVDLFSSVANMNVGDLAIRVSGVAPGYAQGAINNISVRGFDPTLTRLTFDGLSAITGQDGRRPQWGAFSSALFTRMDVIKGQTPDMSADSIGGTINMATPSPLSIAERRRVEYNFGARWAPPFFYRPALEAAAPIQGLGSLRVQQIFDVLGGQRNFGASLSLFHGVNLNETARLTNVYQATTTSPAYNFSTSAQSQLNYRYVSGIDAKLEFKTANDSKFSFDYLFNTDHEPYADQVNYRAFTSQTVATLDAQGNPTGTGAILPGWTEGVTQVRPVASSTYQIQSRLTSFITRQNSFTFGGEHTFGKWKIDYKARYNLTHTDSNSGQRSGFGGLLQYSVTGVGWTIDTTDPVHPRFTQTGGPSIYDLNNYKTGITFTKGITTIDSNVAEAIANATYDPNWSFPIKFKVGVSLKEHDFKNGNVNPRRWSPVAGAQALPAVFRPSTNYLENLPIVDARAVNKVISDPALWTEDLYFAASQALIGTSKVRENIAAEYLMATSTWKRLSVTGGVRFEQTRDRTTYNVPFPVATAAQIPDPIARAQHDWDHPITRYGSYDRAFPSAHFNYSFTKSLVGKASWSTSFGRPAFSSLVSTPSVNNTAQTVTVSNPGLGPQQAKNVDLSLAYYFKPAGFFSVGYFHTAIRDYINTTAAGIIGSGLENGFDGNYSGYQLLTTQNSGSATVSGWEFDYRQQLQFLPSYLKGLEVTANYMFLDTQGNYGGASNLTGSQLAGFQPQSGTLGLRYIIGRFGVNVRTSYQGKFTTVTAANPASQTYRDKYLRTTISLSYRLRPEVQFYVQVDNIAEQPLREYMYSAERSSLRQVGPSHVSFGVKGQF